MRVFVAGATGAIGRQLSPSLVKAGHQVVGMTRSPGKAEGIRAAGAEPVVADALNSEAVMEAVRKSAPEVIVHELTAIDPSFDIRRFDREFALTNRLRTEGTDNLIRAGRAAGCRRIVAQSFAGWPYARTGGPVKTEEDPLDLNPPAALRTALQAIRHLESAVTETPGMEGIVLRYGGFYGPGNAIGAGGALLDQIKRRKIPIIGGGTGIWSFVHIADAAQATVAAVEGRASGIYNIVDDDPAPVADWLSTLASLAGAKPPLRIPAWMGRLAIGKHGVIMMTEARGAANAKAKRELGWEPVWSTWREGFRTGLGESSALKARQAARA